MTRLLLTLTLVAFFAYLLGGAVDYEQGQAGMLPERAGTLTAVGVGGGPHRPGAAPTVGSLARSESIQPLYQGRTARWWAGRAVQARKDANARGRTIRRLRQTARRGIIPWYWLRVGSCESGLRWTYNGSSGFDGALQFHPGTWSAYRLPSYPAFAYLASPFQQLVVAELVLARQGWAAWPACSRKVGLR